MYHYAPERGRPLWAADLTFELGVTDVALLRSIVDAMDGQLSYRMIWDFANPWPMLSQSVQQPNGDFPWHYDGSTYAWTDSGVWSHDLLDYDTIEPALVVNGSYGVGATTLSILYWPASTTVLVRGDLIQIDEYLYVVMGNVWSDGSQAASLEISGGLAAAVNGSSAIRLTQPAARMRLDSVDWSTDRGWNDPYAMATLKFIEVP